MKIKKKSLLSPKTFNYLYSIGAAVVIVGALFKLLHWPFADFMLIVGMGTEAFIFFVSAFDEPAKEPNWEVVYPGIYDKESNLTSEEKQTMMERRKKRALSNVPEGEEHVAANGGGGSGTVIIGSGVPAGGTIVVGGGGTPVANAGGVVTPLAASAPAGSLTPEQADQMTQATEKYVQQLNDITQSLARLQSSMAALEGTSDYAEQMANLNRNIQGLNTIYEIQLKSVSSQLGTIEQVNQGLANIRSLYENGQNDSFRIRQETDQMARQLQQLNEVYARMLQAMTAGYGFQPQPQQPTYPQQPQQPVYPQQPQAQPQQFQQPQQPLYAQR